MVPATLTDLTMLQEDPALFEQARAWRVVPGYLDHADTVLGYFVTMLENGVPPEWANHLVVHIADGAMIGMAGFKGEPSDGTVEIGYGIAPTYRGQGLATETARILVRRAAERGVRTVVAETLAEPSHSTSVLTRVGFARVGEAYDSEDGPIWRWEFDTAALTDLTHPRT